MSLFRIGFSGPLTITLVQADKLTAYYNSLHTEHGYLKRAHNQQGVAAVDTALAAIGLRFVAMSTEAEGYYLDTLP